MKKISIPAALEKAIRREVEKGAGSPLTDILELLDAYKPKGAAGSNPGIGYKELVALFRSYLGDELVTPPSPNSTYIIRTVNKAQELGINKDNVEQLVRGLRKGYPRGPYRLDFVVGRADLHFHAGGESDGHHGRGPLEVYTGRTNQDD
jgi:hypothetical protein